MSEFYSHISSDYDDHEARLEFSLGNPMAVMNDECGDIVVQSGIIEDADIEQGTITLAHINNEERTATVSIPSHDKMLIGYDEIRSHLLTLLNRYETQGMVQSAITAATLQHRFSEELGEISDEFCSELIERLLDKSYSSDDFLPACVFDAPDKVRTPVLQEVARRISLARSLVDILSDRLIMDIITTQVELEGGTEFSAAQQIVEKYGG